MMMNYKFIKGSITQPLLMWILGLPTGLSFLLWFFLFRGK